MRAIIKNGETSRKTKSAGEHRRPRPEEHRGSARRAALVARVTEHSDALTLDRNVFTLRDPAESRPR